MCGEGRLRIRSHRRRFERLLRENCLRYDFEILTCLRYGRKEDSIKFWAKNIKGVAGGDHAHFSTLKLNRDLTTEAILMKFCTKTVPFET